MKKTNRDKRFTVRLTEEDFNNLIGFCENKEISASQFVRIQIKKALYETNNKNGIKE